MNLQTLLYRHVLGLVPDPETWPPPPDVSSLPLPSGRERTDETLHGWAMSPEFAPGWPQRRTAIGAQAYRFTTNGEYDCGWRLCDLATRFLTIKSPEKCDLVIPVPTPPIFTPVEPVEWLGQRLAKSLAATFRPDLVALSAPLADHADRLRHPPLPWGDLFRLTRPESVFNRRVLLIDWRWERGRSLKAIQKLLRHAGAEVVCFSWLE